MTSEILQKATRPFFSTRAGRHLGLGLTSCNEIVQAMSGRLRISSKPGLGTTVEISYPL